MKILSVIIGHRRVLNFLRKNIKNKRLSHAYLFSGPAHLGKKTIAFDFIKMLTGIEAGQAVHPDVLIVEPEITEKNGIKKESEISIVQIREVQHRMNLFAYQAPYKIAVIDRADKMTAEAGNCLLKTLEEPSGNAILILITSNFQSLLPTIISRCQLVNFLPVARKEIEKKLGYLYSGADIKKVMGLANGRPGLALEYLNKPELLDKQNKTISDLEKLLNSNLNARYCYAEKIAKNTPEARRILRYWLVWFRDLLLSAANCPDLALERNFSRYSGFYSLPKLKNIIQSIRRTDRLLANSSINARLALEVLMLEL
ncbi:MAG: hypothetical protein U9P63_00470 [Patescibacteria group bacterium]|nr:hypothetical protein [Patescibacteria group bacterium]